LTVDYVEKFYAAGRIPGGFFKREGKATEKETLTARLIDRPLRPLFPEGFFNEVQVAITVLSCNPEVDPDMPAMLAASAALAISGIPFNGPIGAARVGYTDGQYILCPTTSQLATSQMNLVVAGTESAVLMVESEAQQLSEEVMLGAVVFGHDHMQAAINAIHALTAKAGKAEWDWTAAPANEPLVAAIKGFAESKIAEAYKITQKQARSTRLKEITSEVAAHLEATLADDVKATYTSADVGNILHDMEAKVVRTQILNGEPRIDGRDTYSASNFSAYRCSAKSAWFSFVYTRRDSGAGCYYFGYKS